MSQTFNWLGLDAKVMENDHNLSQSLSGNLWFLSKVNWVMVHATHHGLSKLEIANKYIKYMGYSRY